MGLSDYFTTPTSFRNAQVLKGVFARQQASFGDAAISIFAAKSPPHSSHPKFGHLTLLVFEAVLEVVCVSLPGYIVARLGMFDTESQKFLANLNVALFTPCLIFTKLASQLTAETLADLAIIPFIFVVQTIVSYACAVLVSKSLGLRKRQKNFVIAMGVFGNSNSLPISLVISLSQTIRGLHWDKVPNDNDDEVGARGILYLLIFQQLGQLLRWSWGYNVLLAPADKYSEEDGGTGIPRQLESGSSQYHDEPDEDRRQPLIGTAYNGERDSDDESTRVGNSPVGKASKQQSTYNDSTSSQASSIHRRGANGMNTPLPNVDLRNPFEETKYDEEVGGFKGQVNRAKNSIYSTLLRLRHSIVKTSTSAFSKLPAVVQTVLKKIFITGYRFFAGVWEFMNPPLWAMLIAILVASVPDLQHLFFDEGSFVKNSVTRAISQSAGVAIPLILVVLGGNLARNTLPKTQAVDVMDPSEERKLLIASLVSRMLLPTLVMAPILALTAKYVPVSIVDDKIFVIVCFLLTGAPTALQLAQICQVNNVYMSVMSKILFQSYVVWILPSTLALVMMALEVVEWAT